MTYRLDQISQLQNGAAAWDVFMPNGRYAATVSRKPDGTFRHYYNSDASKGSTRRFRSMDEVFANIDKRLASLHAKRTA